MENVIYNSTNCLRVTLIHYGKAFGLPATPVTLLVTGVNTPAYSHRLRALSILKR